MRPFAADEFGAGSGAEDVGLTDLLQGKAHGNGHFLQVHTDQGTADIQTGFGADMLPGEAA